MFIFNSWYLLAAATVSDWMTTGPINRKMNFKCSNQQLLQRHDWSGYTSARTRAVSDWLYCLVKQYSGCARTHGRRAAGKMTLCGISLLQVAQVESSRIKSKSGDTRLLLCWI